MIFAWDAVSPRWKGESLHLISINKAGFKLKGCICYTEMNEKENR